MPTQKEHYDALLAAAYDWMSGCGTPELFDARVRDTQEMLYRAGIVARAGNRAVDAGCGSGYGALALAQMGLIVDAVDTSEALLRSLNENAARLNLAERIKSVKGDILSFGVPEGSLDAFVCLGDTLTHLTHKEQVADLFKVARKALGIGGKLVVSWRDLSHLPHGADRFIPIRSDEERIFTCFLEDVGDKVHVYDLLHTKGAGGEWSLAKSWYPKLKLSLDFVEGAVLQAGFTLDAVEKGRLLVLVAHRN